MLPSSTVHRTVVSTPQSWRQNVAWDFHCVVGGWDLWSKYLEVLIKKYPWTQMGPLVLIEKKGPCFGGGWPSKIEVSWVLGMYVYIYICYMMVWYSAQSFWLSIYIGILLFATVVTGNNVPTNACPKWKHLVKKNVPSEHHPRYHLSISQNPGYLLYIGGYTTQLYGGYSKPT